MAERTTSDVAAVDPDVVYFRPGDEFTNVAAAELLPRLRLDPEVEELDLLSAAFTVYIDDDEHDVDRDVAIGDGPSVFEAYDDDQFGYRVDVCGSWLHHWVADSLDEYVRLDPALSLEAQVNVMIERSGLSDLIWSDTSTCAWSLPADR